MARDRRAVGSTDEDVAAIEDSVMARADIFDYIETFYNRTRRHNHLGGISPEAFERASA